MPRTFIRGIFGHVIILLNCAIVIPDDSSSANAHCANEVEHQTVTRILRRMMAAETKLVISLERKVNLPFEERGVDVPSRAL